MPPLRTLLGAIDRNRIRGKDYDPYKKVLIIRAKRAGMHKVLIKREFGASYKGIRSTLCGKDTRPDGISQLCLGAPCIYSDQDRRIILRNLRLRPKLTFDQHCIKPSLEYSNT